MKLASLKSISRDGELIVVSRDLTIAIRASHIVANLREAIEDWERVSPKLQELSDQLNSGKINAGFKFMTNALASPLPRAFQWCDGSAYLHHAELVASLTHDVPVTRELPCRVRFFHKMAAAAEFGVLLDKVVVPDRKHDTQNRDDEHEGNNDDLFPRAEALFEFVDYF